MNTQTQNIPPKLLVVGDAVAPTGFARVIRSIIEPMIDDFDVEQLGVNYIGDDHDWPWRIHRAKEFGNQFGFDVLPDLLDVFQPNLIFMVCDHHILAAWLRIIEKWSGVPHCKVIIYAPVDSDPIEPGLAAALTKADRLVTFTKYGQACFRKSMEKYAAVVPAFEPKEADIMPHGISPEIFHPGNNNIDYHLSNEGRKDAKIKLWPDDESLHDSFIVLNANRNQERKRLDVTLRGFAQFAAEKPDNVRLYLHCGVKDQGWNVIDLARQEGILDRLILSTTKGIKPAFSDEYMNRIYNACDVGINTSEAEGWGLVSFEHGASGAAQIAPDHTCCNELWTGHAEMLCPSTSLVHMEALTAQHIISPETVAKALDRLYNDRDYLVKMSKAAFENATQEEYHWQNISDRWKMLFEAELTASSKDQLSLKLE